MYQVVEIVGPAEPWWFFEGWQNDITRKRLFSTLEEALDFYEIEFTKLQQTFEKSSYRANFMSAFYDEGDILACDACGQEEQRYHGLALLQDWKGIDAREARQHLKTHSLLEQLSRQWVASQTEN
ncbi:MAG: DUF1033 family protein [Streptococcaceae bacterium]|jgi:hypothetical protein|nr:DUF1033 family protein [Streptococcaceae bacterium]